MRRSERGVGDSAWRSGSQGWSGTSGRRSGEAGKEEPEGELAEGVGVATAVGEAGF